MQAEVWLRSLLLVTQLYPIHGLASLLRFLVQLLEGMRNPGRVYERVGDLRAELPSPKPTADLTASATVMMGN